jgi:hypothetical protein
MKYTYKQAHEVYVWLGSEGEGSHLAMDYISHKGN